MRHFEIKQEIFKTQGLSLNKLILQKYEMHNY